jgi:hypothetical protein
MTGMRCLCTLIAVLLACEHLLAGVSRGQPSASGVTILLRGIPPVMADRSPSCAARRAVSL